MYGSILLKIFSKPSVLLSKFIFSGLIAQELLSFGGQSGRLDSLLLITTF